MTLRVLATISALALVAILTTAFEVSADCSLPSKSWSLELVSLQATDGLADVTAERERLGETATFHGSTRDSAHPDIPVRATLVWAASESDSGTGGMDWSISLVRDER
jgi:hypothetical protein